MSMPLCIFHCTKCDFEQSFTRAGAHYVYEKNNGETISAPTCIGWCMKCNEVTLLLTGLNPEILNEEILRNEKIISDDINKRSLIRLNLSEYEKQVKSNLLEEINKKKVYLEILKDKVSVNYCLNCNTTDVFPIFLSPDTFSFPETTTYAHINCGGQLQVKWSDVRMSFKSQQKIIKPLFLNKAHERNEEPLSNDKIPHYSFVTGIISKLLDMEAYYIKTHKDKFEGFHPKLLFDKEFDSKLMIERFLFLYAYLSLKEVKFDFSIMKNYVQRIAMEQYSLNTSDAENFFTKKIKFYKTELDIFTKSNFPHPGKVIWALYNPTHKELTHELTKDIEQNFIAGNMILSLFVKVINDEILPE